jgi:hypothetical protein
LTVTRAFKFEMHIFVCSKAPWDHIGDDARSIRSSLRQLISLIPRGGQARLTRAGLARARCAVTGRGLARSQASVGPVFMRLPAAKDKRGRKFGGARGIEGVLSPGVRDFAF